MGKNVDLLIDDIVATRLKGASLVAMRTAQAILADTEEEFESGASKGHLKLTVQKLGAEVIRSRPSNTSLRNAVKNTLYKTEKVDDTDDFRVMEVIRSNVSSFVETVSTSAERISRLGANIIRDGNTILTGSYSSMVKGILNTAFNNLGKEIHVYVTETRPRYQGLKMVRELLELGIPTTLVVDSSVRHIMKDVDMILVGTDTVTSDGSAISKIGTSLIALAAHEARVPFYVATPTFKFSEETLSGVMITIEEAAVSQIIDGSGLEDCVGNPLFNVRNPAFDATPPEFIRGIITELYIMSPYSVGDYLAKMSGVID